MQSDQAAVPSASALRKFRLWGGNWVTMAAFIILTVMVFCGVFAPLLSRYQPNQQNLLVRLKPPAWSEGGVPEHPLGTDDLGRDLFTRIVYGARTSLLVGLLTAICSGGVGIAVGLLSGYFPKFDMVIMRVADIQLAFPPTLLALAIVAVIGGGFNNLILVLTLTNWVQFSRVIRSEVLSIRQSDYILAVQTLGVGKPRILYRHILPNIIAPTVTISTFQIAAAITAEASLSFLGLGIPPTIPSWGNILHSGQLYMETAWWISVFPGVCILLIVIAINLLGDALRDYMDPRARRNMGIV